MCGTKRLNPFFRLHETSEVLNKLNKLIMGVWQVVARISQQGGQKPQGGVATQL